MTTPTKAQEAIDDFCSGTTRPSKSGLVSSTINSDTVNTIREALQLLHHVQSEQSWEAPWNIPYDALPKGKHTGILPEVWLNLRDAAPSLRPEFVWGHSSYADAVCIKCGQKIDGQSGEYPCKQCGLPTVHFAEYRQEERARALDIFNAGYISMRDLGGHKGDNIFIYQFKGYQAKAIEDALYALSQPVQEGK